VRNRSRRKDPVLKRGQQSALDRIRGYDSAYVIGIDEVGLGALAGPVSVGAVVMPKNWRHADVTDSKLMTHKKRVKALHEVVYPSALLYCVLSRTSEDVDKYGIERCRLELTEAAAVFCRSRFPGALVVQDGEHPALVDGTLRGVVSLAKADFLVPAVSAASILAKVTRDLYMEEAHKHFDKYDFLHNRGYRSMKHELGILKYGPCLIHRMSYKLVPELIATRLNRG
jgi:ribonuclease HII